MEFNLLRDHPKGGCFLNYDMIAGMLNTASYKVVIKQDCFGQGPNDKLGTDETVW